MAANCLSRRVLHSEEATLEARAAVVMARTKLARAQATISYPQRAMVPVASPTWRW